MDERKNNYGEVEVGSSEAHTLENIKSCGRDKVRGRLLNTKKQISCVVFGLSRRNVLSH